MKPSSQLLSVFLISFLISGTEQGQVTTSISNIAAGNYDPKTATPEQLFAKYREAHESAFSRGSTVAEQYLANLPNHPSQNYRDHFISEILPEYLVNACKTGDLKMIELLVRHHVDILKKSTIHNMSALSVALQKDVNVAVLKALLQGKTVQEAGIDYSVFTECRNSKAYDKAIVLLQHGMIDDPHFYSRADHSCAVWNYENDKPLWIKVLVEANVDLSVRRPNLNHTLLHLIAKKGDKEMLKYLSKQGKILSSVTYNSVGESRCKYLNVSARDSKGRSPLEIAIVENRADIARLLIELGVMEGLSDIEISDLFILAVKHDNKEIMKKLFKANVNIFKPDSSGDSIMARMIREVQVHDLNLFIIDSSLHDYIESHAADINEHDSHGMTLLSASLELDNSILFTRLLDYGADPTIKDKAPGATLLQKACLKGFYGVIRTLSEFEGFNLAEVDEDGNSLLHYAISTKERESTANDIMSFLINNGVDINSRNLEGLTVLESAVARNRINCAEFLINNGADMNLFKPNSKPLLFTAIKNESYGMVRILVKAGAKIAEPFEGTTPIEYAAALKARKGTKESEDVLKYLQDHNSFFYRATHFTKK